MALCERFADCSVAQVLEAQAQERPNSVFLIYGDKRLTYGQVDARASALAAALAELGVEPGDRVAVDMPNWPEFVLAMFAAAKLGAIIVPLNPRFTIPELQYMLRHSEATVVVTCESFNGTDYLQLFEGFLTSLPDLQYLVTVGEADLWYDDRIYQFEDLLSSGEGRVIPALQVDPQKDTFAILYTSGTMGKPKGVALTHANVLHTAAQTVDAIALSADDVVFVSSDGYLLEGPSSTLVYRRGDTLYSPGTGLGILDGTTLANVFRFARERALETAFELGGPGRLGEADAAWLVSSVRLAAPIRSVDGAGLPVDREFTGALNSWLRVLAV